MACYKIAYETRDAAGIEIDRIAEYNFMTCRPRYSYLCPFCKKWHLTSQPPKTLQTVIANKTDPNHKQKIFIKSESEYWLTRLGDEPEQRPKIRKTYLKR